MYLYVGQNYNDKKQKNEIHTIIINCLFVLFFNRQSNGIDMSILKERSIEKKCCKGTQQECHSCQSHGHTLLALVKKCVFCFQQHFFSIDLSFRIDMYIIALSVEE